MHFESKKFPLTFSQIDRHIYCPRRRRNNCNMIVVKRALGEECDLSQNPPSHLFLAHIETTKTREFRLHKKRSKNRQIKILKQQVLKTHICETARMAIFLLEVQADAMHQTLTNLHTTLRLICTKQIDHKTLWVSTSEVTKF